MSHHTQSTDEIRASFSADYDFERELLGGGMSRVFLVNERALNRKVVIKVLPPDLAAGVNRERFRREVQLAAQLQHPHIVPLYAAGAQGDLLYYTMPFIEGESLKQELAAHKTYSPREVVHILHDVVDALGYAHARGVIHRDIKPGNVLRSGHHAVVTDFGVAKAISASLPAVGMTTSGMAIGTPAYMAPEQLAGDPAADHRVDLYAVGLLAYELLTGEGPFQSASPQETLAAQLTRTPKPVDKIRRDVPAGLSALVMRCLAKRPEDRPQSAAELHAALDAIQFPSGEFSASSGTKRGWIALAAATVIVAGVALWQGAAGDGGRVKVVTDTVTMSPAGPLLTRAESLAIAKAVDVRLEEQRQAWRGGDSGGTAGGPGGAAAFSGDALKRMADSIRDEIQRAVFDSLARAQAANRGGRGAGDLRAEVSIGPRDAGARFAGLAPELDSILKIMDQSGRAGRAGALDPVQFARRAASLGAQRRVVVTEPRITSRRLAGAAPIGGALADTLRRRLGADQRFTVVNADSVRAALLKTRTIDDLSEMLDADVFASIAAFPARGDSLVWQVTLRDLTAHSAFGTRAWTTAPTPVGAPIPGLDSLLARTGTQLNEMDRAPRRPPPDDAPGGPLSKEAFDARAANMGGRRRLIVWTHPTDRAHPEIEAAGTAITDIIRKSLAGVTRYEVLPLTETLNVLGKSRLPNVVADAARAELMVTIRGSVQAQRADSVLWTITVRDLGAFGPYQQRSVSAGRVAAGALTANADSLTQAVVRTVDTLDRAPRQSAPRR